MKLPRALEATYVTELGGQHHRGLGLEAAEAAESVDDGLVAGREREPLDPLVEVVPALELVLEEGQVLGEHGAVLVGERTRLQDLAHPVHVPNRPVRALAEDEAAASHELQDVVARLDDLALEGLAAAHQIADALVGLGRDVDQHETVVTEVAGRS